MKIQVTQEDIDNGTPKRCKWCPVALAVKRAANHPFAWVDNTHISWGRDSHVTVGSAMTPKSVRAFLDAFDAGQPVEPFEFEL